MIDPQNQPSETDERIKDPMEVLSETLVRFDALADETVDRLESLARGHWSNASADHAEAIDVLTSFVRRLGFVAVADAFDQVKRPGPSDPDRVHGF